MTDSFRGLMQDYIGECLPLAEAVTDASLRLERAWNTGEEADDVLAPLPGILHTIKGNSAMMGLVPMQALAHALEDVCGLLTRRPDLRAGSAAVLVEGAGLLVELVRSAGTTEVRPDEAERFVARTREYVDAAGRSTPAEASAMSTPEQRREERREGERRRDVMAGAAIDTVRVDFRRLDAMLETLGEAVIAHAAALDARARLGARVGQVAELQDLDRAVLALEKALRQLDRELMRSRLLPVTTVFSRFARLVRDLAQAESKRVRLVTRGGETELDKAVLDRLGEPLVHLVTNAIIHGIEPAAERARAGKPPEATLTLAAEPRSDRVLVTVADDGQGLDPEKILFKARALGMKGEWKTPEDIYALAFLPGVSTAEKVSALSGRGVGLDVVANAIRALGGNVEVTSDLGRGTTFTLSLPLTLAVLRSLIVEVDGERYAVPLKDVAGTARLRAEALHEIHGRGMVLWRDELLPVVDGGVLLGTGVERASGRAYCLALQSGPKRRGVLVDRLVSHQDIVVKALDAALGHPATVSGATILSDGRVTLILDAVRIVEPRVT